MSAAVTEKIRQYYVDNVDVYKSKCALFINSLREKGVVRRACADAGLDRTTPYIWRANDSEFREAWDNALEDATDQVEESLLDMAVSRKNVVATIFYLKNNREKYREETRIIISKDDMDHVIEHAIAEHQLPALGPAILDNAIEVGGSSPSQSSSSSDHATDGPMDQPTPTSE